MKAYPKKFQIRHGCMPNCTHAWKRPVTNYTGKPWLIDYPPGHQYNYAPWGSWSSCGSSFDTYEEAREYLERRINDTWQPTGADVMAGRFGRGKELPKKLTR